MFEMLVRSHLDQDWTRLYGGSWLSHSLGLLVTLLVPQLLQSHLSPSHRLKL